MATPEGKEDAETVVVARVYLLRTSTNACTLALSLGGCSTRRCALSHLS